MATEKLTILMIDDDPEDIAIVRGLLDRVPVWTVELLECADATSAVQQIKQRHPNLILLDFNFGSASGLDVLPTLRSTGFEGPIVLLSGCGKDEMASMLIAGISDFLSKSALTSLTLYHTITLAIEKQQLPAGKSVESPRLSSTDQQRRIPTTSSSSPPRVRYQ